MDEITLLEVAEVIKAEVGVTHHRIIQSQPRRWFPWPFPQRKIVHAPEGRTPKDGKTMRAS